MELQKEALDYIKEGIKIGYSIDYLKQEMLKEGYSKKEVRHYFTALNPEKVKREQKFRNLIWLVVAVGIYFILVFDISIMTDTNAGAIFLGFLPLLVSIVGCIIVLEYFTNQRSLIWSLPFFTAAVFYAVGAYGNLTIMAEYDIASLSIFNLVASFVFVTLVHVIGIDSPWLYNIVEATKTEDESQLEDAPGETFSERIIKHLNNVKESSSTLNLAVNRVYSGRNGGSSQLRNKLRILSSWTRDLKADNNHDIITQALKNIQERLSVYYSSESELFGDIQLKNIDRDLTGNSRIVDILIDNTSEETQRAIESIMNNSAEITKLLES